MPTANPQPISPHRRRAQRTSSLLQSDPLWYKDAIIYELHVRAFCDSDGDGIGDFKGLLSKLDYLQELGITAIWLLPFYPSPLRDDGYDIADYTDVHPSYGTLADFKRFLAAAHDRGLRVITELAINHTSSEHPWFQRARRAPPGSKRRDFYVWSDDPQRYRQARVIFEDFETSNWVWDPVAEAYYWHRFYSHQPDLNFDNPEVEKAVFGVLDFWMDLGVDGMRLDAVPYLFERDGTNCENLPETHAFLKRLCAHVEAKYDNRMLLAEANQWPEDAAAYFGDGDECHMNFHFPVMPRLFMSLQLESRFPIVDILEQTPRIPDNCQWALFLRNHDELTLEMVTDEDRDYMYRTYAQDPRMRVNVGIRRRLSPLLKLRSKVELLNGLLMSLPGTPVIYYGDEIGQGDNVYLGDRNGVRTPMQWSSDRNAGFSRANPQQLYLPVIIDSEYHYEALNVEVQQHNPESLLSWMKRLIAMRRRYRVFGRGEIEFLDPDNSKVLCFIRSLDGEQILVVANLSRHAQYVELDLKRHAGMAPVEMSGSTVFPTIGETPYLLTLGGYQFHWFELRADQRASQAPSSGVLPELSASDFRGLFSGPSPELEACLRDYIRQRRWFRGKTRSIKSLRCVDELPLVRGDDPVSLLIVAIEYTSDLPERYLLPVALTAEPEDAAVLSERPETVLARVQLGARSGSGSGRRTSGVLHDPSGTPAFARALLSLFTRKRSIQGAGGALSSAPGRTLRQELAAGPEAHTPRVGAAEQSNTTIFFGHEYALKLFRQLEPGLNPDAEISAQLTRQGFPNIARVLGTLSYDGPQLQAATVGMMQRFVPSVGDAWGVTLDWLQRSVETALTHADQAPTLPPGGLLGLREKVRDQGLPEVIAELIGGYLHMARLLGERTAELHWALAGDLQSEAFRPEPFAGHYQRAMLQAARDRLTRTMQLLRKQVGRVPESAQGLAREVLSLQDQLEHHLASIQHTRIEASRIRCHGDFHLGQVLYDGRDFVIIDFEGEPAVSMGVRRLKGSALYDVCGMVRSFHYAVTRALQDPLVTPEARPRLEPWAHAWYAWVSASFLDAYLERAGEAPFVPTARDGLVALIDTHLVDKCAYELSYELNNRPDWVEVPLLGLRALVT